MRNVLILLAASMLTPGAAFALECTPNDNSARILASPDPQDIHPDWSGDSTIGLSWTFEGRPTDSAGDYMKGKLISPKGGVTNSGVYILADEWDCN